MSASASQTTISSPKPEVGGGVDSYSAYICTICWQRQARGSQPKLLGSSARIVCKPCWRTVLDLSICWVCGECIVRGDEVVSLGWCFWHRGCFGCLVCGTRMEVPAIIAGSMSSDGEKRVANKRGECGDRDGSRAEEDEEDERKSTRCTGVELEEIPLCGVCEVETAGESTNHVLERGLETVTRFDGGLSRSRLDMLVETKNPRCRGEAARVERSSSNSLYPSMWPKRNISNEEDLFPLLENAADMGISDDGCVDGYRFHGYNEICEATTQTYSDQEGADAVVYVSILNPVGEPAFRPSKTKQLPRWMDLLPSNVHRKREPGAKSFIAVTPGSLASDGLDDSDGDNPISRPRLVSLAGPGKQQRTSPPIVERAQMQRRPIIPFDPMPKGNTIEDAPPKSQSTNVDLDTSTTEGWSCSCQSWQRIPYPRRSCTSQSRPSISRKETSSYFSYRTDTAVVADRLDRSSCMPGLRSDACDCLQAGLPVKNVFNSPQTVVDSPSPCQSSEYLTRYQPKRNVDARCEPYVVGDAEPILKKIKRQNAILKDNKRHSVEKDIDVKGKGACLKTPDGKFELDARREDLNKELMSLFCEE